MNQKRSADKSGRGMRRKELRSRLCVPIQVCGFAALVSFFAACGGDKPVDDVGDILLRMDGKSLSLQEVVAKIPVGIEPADSAALFDRIVGNWIESAVLVELAESKLPDIDEIDRKVEAYRNRLIVMEYLGRMKESQRQKADDADIRAYYESHKRELLTESPLIKGVYMKVPSSSAGVDRIKELIFRSSEADIDQLEKDWMESALQYDYFGSTWIDWQTLADQIPYRFYNPDAFLETHKDFETTYGGSTYIFHISDYLPTGSEQPYEFAAGRIAALLDRSNITKYEEALVRSLVEKSVKEGRLVAVGYDPVKRTFLRKTHKQINKDTK